MQILNAAEELLLLLILVPCPPIVSQGLADCQRMSVPVHRECLQPSAQNSSARVQPTSSGGSDRPDAATSEPYHCLSRDLRRILSGLRAWAPVLAAFASFITALVALYVGDWKERLERPRLGVAFAQDHDTFCQTISFEPFRTEVFIDDQPIPIVRPGFSARAKIVNDGKTTARSVEARIEKIELSGSPHGAPQVRYYHPTLAKWSGERGWSSVDIPPKSHVFLDLFWANNEAADVVLDFNRCIIASRGVFLKDSILEDAVEKTVSPTAGAYWNVWVDTSYDRGLPDKYHYEGSIHVFFVINAGNCEPLTFTALIDWCASTWNRPTISIHTTS